MKIKINKWLYFKAYSIYSPFISITFFNLSFQFIKALFKMSTGISFKIWITTWKNSSLELNECPSNFFWHTKIGKSLKVTNLAKKLDEVPSSFHVFQENEMYALKYTDLHCLHADLVFSHLYLGSLVLNDGYFLICCLYNRMH